MDYVMVTLIASQNEHFDLKVPVFVKIEELLSMLSESLQLTTNRDSRIQAEPMGRILDNDQTLEEQGITHGALLTLI